MSDAKAAWEQVGSTFSGLGTKLRLHFEQARSDDDATTDRPTGSTADPAAGETATGPAYAPPPSGPAGAEPGVATGSGEAGGEAAAGSGGAAAGGAAGGGREDVKEALRKLGAALDDAFEALGAAAKDPAVKEDVRQVGQSLTGALSATFADVGDDLRRAFRRTKE